MDLHRHCPVRILHQGGWHRLAIAMPDICRLKISIGIDRHDGYAVECSVVEEADDLSHTGVVARPDCNVTSHSDALDAGRHERSVCLARSADHVSSSPISGTGSRELRQ